MFTKLNFAFEALNAEGFGIRAEHNFMCCSSCAWSQHAQQVESKEIADPGLGFVFYHEQDTDTAYNTGKLHIRYGANEDTQLITTKALGTLLSSVFNAHGIEHDWDGCAGSTIVVKVPHDEVDWTQYSEDYYNDEDE